MHMIRLQCQAQSCGPHAMLVLLTSAFCLYIACSPTCSISHACHMKPRLLLCPPLSLTENYDDELVAELGLRFQHACIVFAAVLDITVDG